VTEFLDGKVRLHPGDCMEIIKGLPNNSIDSVVTDPPYALVSIGKRFSSDTAAPAQFGRDGAYARASAGFMGKKWDTGEVAFAIEFWMEVLRVLKPGGHVIAFGGTRTYHRLAIAIEDAGFEIRDQKKFMHRNDLERDAFFASLTDEQQRQFIKLFAEFDELGQLSWDYGSGFPKSHNVGKTLDRMAGAEREVIAEGAPVKRMIPGADQHKEGWEKTNGRVYVPTETAPATAAAQQWDGWGSALKPAWEPIVLARKPMIGSIAENVLEHGTGAINIDGCRIEAVEGDYDHPGNDLEHTRRGAKDWRMPDQQAKPNAIGRFPANIIHDGSDEVIAAFPAEAGAFAPVKGTEPSNSTGLVYNQRDRTGTFHHGDNGSAARFFYTSKADAEDRLGSKHPTVKPLDLMQYLVRLVTPPGGLVLDPFAGTGTTGEAAWREGMRAILIEREEEYQADIAMRMDLALHPTRRAAVAKSKNKLQGAEGTPLFGGVDG
jgi:DNA modification methylase